MRITGRMKLTDQMRITGRMKLADQMRITDQMKVAETMNIICSGPLPWHEGGEGAVHPNPMVGAVLVKDGRVIAEDYHRVYGGFHAERGCLLNCREPAKGGTLYVTLEPCCHYGKTPPCTDIIIDSASGVL